MTIGILTTLWKRHALARIVLEHYAHLDLPGVRFVLLAVGSEGDVSRSLAEESGWEYIEHPNDPLSDKWNAGIATLRGRVDAVLIVGSDDIMTIRAIEMVLEQIRSGSEAVGLKDLHYYDTRTGDAYYGVRHMPGAGMMVTADALDRVGWQPWESGLNRYLDRSFTNRLQTKAYPCRFKYIENCRDKSADMVDIKTSQNIWQVVQIAAKTGRVHSVSAASFDHTFPDLRDKLKQID